MMPMLSLLALDSRFVAFIALAKLHVVLLGVVVVWKTVFVVMGGVDGEEGANDWIRLACRGAFKL